MVAHGYFTGAHGNAMSMPWWPTAILFHYHGHAMVKAMTMPYHAIETF